MAEAVVESELRISPVLPWLVAMAFLMQMLDGTVLDTALPSIAASLQENPLKMQSVIIAYMLTVALLIPASGWLADRFGTRRVFFYAIVVFTLGSVLCALSTTLEGLVLCRIFQGIGGATMAPVGRLTVLRVYPRAQLLQILSFITVPGLIGPLLGPTVGGFLVQYLSWHWIFLMNIPIGIAGCLLTLRYLPNVYGKQKTPFDVLGFFLFGFAMILLSLAVGAEGELGLGWKFSALGGIFGTLLLFLYCLHAVHVEYPLFRLSIFKNRSFSVGIAGNVFARLGSGAMPFLMPLFLQMPLGFYPSKAGLCMIPMSIASLFAKAMAGVFLKRFGFRRVLAVNTTLLGAMIASFYLVGPHTPLWALLLHLSAFGAVNAMQFSAMNTLVVIDLPQEDASSGNSILSVVMQIAMSFGIALAAIFLDLFSGSAINLHAGGNTAAFSSPETLRAFQLTFAAVGFAAMLATFIFLAAPRNAGSDAGTPKLTDRKDHKE